MSKELEKQYNPKNVEDRIYKDWLNNKYFHAKREEGKKTYKKFKMHTQKFTICGPDAKEKFSQDNMIVIDFDLKDASGEKSYELNLEAASKWPATYAEVSKLKDIYEPFINKEEVVGLAIATRCDALDNDVLDYLEDIAKRIPLTVEIGLQTANDKTALYINRGHKFSLFVEKVNELRTRNIDVVVHLINGLPNETKEDNLETIKKIRHLDIQGIKFHSLFIEKDTRLEKIFNECNYHVLDIDEYIDIVISQLELLPEHIVIQRLTGDPVASRLAFPLWSIKKINVLNGIDKEMKRRSTFQGRLYE